MGTNRFYSPLRYPGGKKKLVPFVKSLLHENGLVGCEYIEPFAGGAGVALSLLFDEYVSKIKINDFDRSIYAFWHSVIHKNKQFCHRIENVDIDIETWIKQKELQKNKRNESLFDLGFSTFYLNRTNISGIIKGGVIGGKSQSGKYKIDARFNKKDLINRIRKINKYKEKITIENENALELLSQNSKNSFVYLDPPYVKKAKNLYMNFYEKDDHQKIAEFLLSKQAEFNWLLSYDEDEIITSLYSCCKSKLSWSLGYSASKTKVKELLFISRNLNIDDSINIIDS